MMQSVKHQFDAFVIEHLFRFQKYRIQIQFKVDGADNRLYIPDNLNIDRLRNGLLKAMRTWYLIEIHNQYLPNKLQKDVSFHYICAYIQVQLLISIDYAHIKFK